MESASGPNSLFPPRVLYAAGPVPPRLRVLNPGDGVHVRCGTPPLQAAHRISSPVPVVRSVQAVQPCRTPSPVRRLDLRAEMGSPSPARILCHMPSPPVANISPCRRTPSPAMRSASPQLAMWHAPPQRPVRLAPIAMAAPSSQRPQHEMARTYVSQAYPRSGIAPSPNRQPIPTRQEDASSPEHLSDLDISDREVSSNATTAVSPQTPLEPRGFERQLCEPQGPPPQRPVRSSQTSETRQCIELREEFQRRMADKDQEIHTLRSLAASTAEELETTRLRLTCIVCADADVQCIFQPCHHVVCCQECATQCQVCPVCRCSIEMTAAVYLP